MWSRMLLPVMYLAISVLMFHLALHSKDQKLRLFLLPFFLLSASLSVLSSKYFILIPGLTSLWSQGLILNIIHIISLLYIRRWPAPPPAPEAPSLTLIGRLRHRWEATYRVWGNPRLIGVHRKPSGEIEESSQSTVMFLFLRLAKLAVYYYINFKILPKVVSKSIGGIYPEDVSQERQKLFRRIFDIASREVIVRSYASVLWIWQSLVYLDGMNAILAMFFVSIGLDRPRDWPHIFGDPRSITSLRTFWSKFWHQIAVRPYTNIAMALARLPGLRSDSAGHKVFIAFIVFGLSGVCHGMVSWRIGRDGWSDVWWFMLNFVTCMAETMFAKTLLPALCQSKTLNEIRKSWFATLCGRAWVFAFMFWTVPKWQYPAMYKEAVYARQMAAWDLIFSKMEAKAT